MDLTTGIQTDFTINLTLMVINKDVQVLQDAYDYAKNTAVFSDLSRDYINAVYTRLSKYIN